MDGILPMREIKGAKSYDLINNFVKKNNFGLVNAGISAFLERPIVLVHRLLLASSLALTLRVPLTKVRALMISVLVLLLMTAGWIL